MYHILSDNLCFNTEHNVFVYRFPLTKTGGKFRIKKRLTFSDYGLPIAPTKTIITAEHYLEWQISYYSGELMDNIGYIEAHKQINELSAFLFYAFKYSFISKDEIIALKSFIETNNIFIENTQEIQRTNFVIENLGGIDFLKSKVSYPLLVYQFKQQDILCEIIIKEKQLAIGIMPMLYFCLPMSVIYNKNKKQNFIGRCIESKEDGYLYINKNNIDIFMQMFKIFGILSSSHKHDCLQILNYILSR